MTEFGSKASTAEVGVNPTKTLMGTRVHQIKQLDCGVSRGSCWRANVNFCSPLHGQIDASAPQGRGGSLARPDADVYIWGTRFKDVVSPSVCSGTEPGTGILRVGGEPTSFSCEVMERKKRGNGRNLFRPGAPLSSVSYTSCEQNARSHLGLFAAKRPEFRFAADALKGIPFVPQETA